MTTPTTTNYEGESRVNIHVGMAEPNNLAAELQPPSYENHHFASKDYERRGFRPRC